MSGLELGVAIAKGVQLTSKAVVLIAKIKRNIGVAEDNKTFAISLLQILNSMHAFFADKQMLDDWELKGLNPAWHREIPQVLADLKRCKEDLDVVAGTSEGKKIHKRVKRRLFAVANAEAAAQELKLVDLKISATNSCILTLESGDLVLQQGERVTTQVDQMGAHVDSILEEVRRHFQPGVHGLREELIAPLAQEMQTLFTLTPSPARSSATEQEVATLAGIPPPAGRSAVVVVKPAQGPSYSNYEVARSNIEELFPKVTKFLRRLESRRIGLSLSETEYDCLRTVFQNLWAPWEVDSSLVEPVIDKRTRRTKMLGEGAYGKVFEYRLRTKSGMSAKVAVKVIDRDISTSDFHSDFFREASLCYRLCHPCIVKFHGAQWPSLPGMMEGSSSGGGAGAASEAAAGNAEDSSEESADSDDGSGGDESSVTSEAWLVLERMDGDLADMTRKGKLTNPEDVLRALTDATEALTYMHEQGILHLDVRPQNILVRTSEGRLLDRAKLTDFGVSLQKRERMTQLTTMRSRSSVRPKAIGTPAFMAPELFTSGGTNSGRAGSSSWERPSVGRGAQSTLSPALDTYSFGVTLAAAWNLVPNGAEVPPPACFAGGQETVRGAAQSGILSRQVAEWVREVFRGRGALLEIAAACTRLHAEERPRMAAVHREMEAVVNAEEEADVELTAVRLMGVNVDDVSQVFDAAWRYDSEGDSKAGPVKDDAKAARLYKVAVGKGHAGAMVNLGFMYLDGRGVVKNEVEAVRLFKLAVGKGEAAAMNGLGFMYANSLGVGKNEVEAVRLYKLAVGKGDVYAMNNLGSMYQFGRGVEKNEVEAVRLYKLAAEGGNKFAMGNLGIVYEFGRCGVRKDISEAKKLYEKAAELGHEDAKNRLRSM